eukprot:g45251.t1
MEKDIKDSEICVEHANVLGHFEIKKEVVLGLLKSVKVEKSPGPKGIYPRDSQHGFMQGRSCLTNLIEFFKEMTKVIEEGIAVDVAYLNFSKAFDRSLIQKIEMYRIHGDLATSIQN